VWHEVVSPGNSGGFGSATSWKERVSCWKERDSWFFINKSNGQESSGSGFDMEWQAYSCMSFLEYYCHRPTLAKMLWNTLQSVNPRPRQEGIFSKG
jgi:hypothetical protein